MANRQEGILGRSPWSPPMYTPRQRLHVRQLTLKTPEDCRTDLPQLTSKRRIYWEGSEGQSCDQDPNLSPDQPMSRSEWGAEGWGDEVPCPAHLVLGVFPVTKTSSHNVCFWKSAGLNSRCPGKSAGLNLGELWGPCLHSCSVRVSEAQHRNGSLQSASVIRKRDLLINFGTYAGEVGICRSFLGKWKCGQVPFFLPSFSQTGWMLAGASSTLFTYCSWSTCPAPSVACWLGPPHPPPSAGRQLLQTDCHAEEGRG